MKITKENDELVLRLPLRQPITNPYDEEVHGYMDSLVGIVAGNEYSLSYLIDMDYKGKAPQEGMPVIMFETEEELREVCKELGLEVWKYETCSVCKKPLRGVHTLGENGAECLDHEQR